MDTLDDNCVGRPVGAIFDATTFCSGIGAIDLGGREGVTGFGGRGDGIDLGGREGVIGFGGIDLDGIGICPALIGFTGSEFVVDEPNPKKLNSPPEFLGLLEFTDAVEFLDAVEFTDAVEFLDTLEFLDTVEFLEFVEELEPLEFEELDPVNAANILHESSIFNQSMMLSLQNPLPVPCIVYYRMNYAPLNPYRVLWVSRPHPTPAT